MAEEAAEEARLLADTSKVGKRRYAEWRLERAKTHGNIQPGLYGKPMFHFDFSKIILDALHLALLNVPKIPWKHGILNNASDLAPGLLD